jgi:RNA polymerase sigma-70 factor (ECF subfamily)
LSRSRHEVRNREGTRIAFEELYKEHFDGIFRYILYRVGHVVEAEDLTAQTFFKALRSLWRFRWSRGSFSAWLYRIATNEVNSHHRRRRPSVPWDLLDAADGSPVAQEAAAAEELLSRNERFRKLQGGLHRLKPEEQALVLLRYVEEKPYGEIAAILRKKVGAVTMRTHRALARLKTEIERQEVEDEKARERVEGPAGRGRGPVQADAAP